MSVEVIINVIRNSDKYIETIYMKGGCYQFFKILKALYPEALPLIDIEKDHIVTRINGINYDITGIVSGNYIEMTLDDVETAKGWSFSRTMALSVGECEFCEEPILV